MFKVWMGFPASSGTSQGKQCISYTDLQLDVFTNVLRSSCKVAPISDFTKIKMYRRIVVGILNTKYLENLPDQIRAVPYGERLDRANSRLSQLPCESA